MKKADLSCVLLRTAHDGVPPISCRLLAIYAKTLSMAKLGKTWERLGYKICSPMCSSIYKGREGKPQSSVDEDPETKCPFLRAMVLSHLFLCI
jgi:hypothetical protein